MDSPAPTSCNFGSDPFIRFLPIACFLPDMGTAFPDRLSRPPGDGSGCRKSGLRHFFEVFIAPLRLRRGQGAMQGNPCYARLFADLTRMSPNPIKASGGQSRAPPVAGGARRKPSEQGSARKAPRADAARPLRTALRPPNPQGFFDRLSRPEGRLLAFRRAGGEMESIWTKAAGQDAKISIMI